MKRTLALILAISTLLLLFGCSNTGASDSTENTISTTTATSPVTEATEAVLGNEEVTQLPMYAISLPPVTETKTTSDGITVFKYAYQNISLILPEPEVADRIVLNYLNYIDGISTYADSAANTAMQAYSDAEQWSPHLLQMLYSPMRFDASVLSLHGDKVSYTGGAHSVYTGQSLNYDLVTGNALLLTDIMCNEVTDDSLEELIINILSAIKEDKNLFPSYDDILSQLMPEDLTAFQNWYFSGNGLCFHFAPGEVAPFSSGSIIAEIPYNLLTGILQDAYFPAEEMYTDGTIDVQLFADATVSEFNRFSEIILEQSATKFLLYTDAPVYDIRLIAGSADAEAGDYTQHPTVYAAHTLSAGDAILVEADLSTFHLLLTYRSEDGFTRCSITLDGETILFENV